MSGFMDYFQRRRDKNSKNVGLSFFHGSYLPFRAHLFFLFVYPLESFAVRPVVKSNVNLM